MTFRYCSQSLYDFALRAPTPPLERLILIVIASTLDHIEYDDPWPSEYDLQFRTGLSPDALWKGLRSLVKSGLIDEIKTSCGGTVYAIPPALPILHQHIFESHALGLSYIDIDQLNAELDESSGEIRALLRLGESSLEEIKREKPGFKSLLERWEKIENERAHSRNDGENGFNITGKSKEEAMT